MEPSSRVTQREVNSSDHVDFSGAEYNTYVTGVMKLNDDYFTLPPLLDVTTTTRHHRGTRPRGAEEKIGLIGWLVHGEEFVSIRRIPGDGGSDSALPRPAPWLL